MRLDPNIEEKLWDEFLERWPLSGLRSLDITDYTKVGDGSSFTYWLESKTEQLGSIWGGSSFKFGIYHRGDNQPKENGRGRVFGTDYAWYEKYGATPEEAFSNVIKEVVKVAEAASTGDFAAVETADLGASVKWKIAFLYQNREKPSLLPIYKLEILRAVVNTNERQSSCSRLNAQLMARRGDMPLFSFANELWTKAQDLLAQKLDQNNALEFMKSRFRQIKPEVKYMAGFSTEEGRQLALNRRGKDVTVFVEPGEWPSLVPGVTLHESYEKNQPRIDSLEANAPKLYVGYPAEKLNVPTMAVLSALCDAYEGAESLQSEMLKVESFASTIQIPKYNKPKISMNRILYGPPGTGKTFKTAELAVEICDGSADMSRQELMTRYEELRKEGRISFVTFHQSYGYEDFVEGLRPELKDGQVSYRVRPGTFREACDAARRSTLVKPGLTGKPLKDRTIYKMSLGIAGTSEGKLAFQECIEQGYVLLGYGDDMDFSECNTADEIRKKVDEENKFEKPESHARYVSVFKDELQVGDIIVVSQGNLAFRAIGEVTGEYEFLEAAAAGSFHQMRPVRWLAVFEGNRAGAEIYDRKFVQSTLYKLDQSGLKLDVLDGLIRGQQGANNQNFVLIIDEINRANISKVFGELITLLEPDKREGADNALTVKLPYSGDEFSVPSNLFVVGTMNTADRSIALLDTALRRRFEFEELQPDHTALPGNLVEGVDLRAMLQALNERIEYLFDRDHTIGHAFFISVQTLPELEVVFRRKVIPLLQEYFYEDWSKVRLVLNDQDGAFIEAKNSIPKGLEYVVDGYDPKLRYKVRGEHFPLHAFLNIYQ